MLISRLFFNFETGFQLTLIRHFRVGHLCTAIARIFHHILLREEEPTLWFNHAQNGLGPRAGSSSQGSNPTLGDIHHPL